MRMFSRGISYSLVIALAIFVSGTSASATPYTDSGSDESSDRGAGGNLCGYLGAGTTTNSQGIPVMQSVVANCDSSGNFQSYSFYCEVYSNSFPWNMFNGEKVPC